MSKMFQVYGIGQALIPVLPPPLGFANAPTSNQTNYEIGQLVYAPAHSPTAFYLYGGAGSWIEFATSSGAIVAINGTANQVTASTTSGVTTLSLPSAITVPGSLATTTTLTVGTKLLITTGSNASLGTSTAISTGSVTVATSAVTAASKIFLTRAVSGGTLGNLSVGTITANTQFTITSDQTLDTSTVNWLIIN